MKQFLLIPFLLIATLFFSLAQSISTFAPVGVEWWYQGHQYTEGYFKDSRAHQYVSMEEVEYKGQLCRRLDVFEHIVDSFGIAHKTKLSDEYVYNNDDTVFYYSNNQNRFVPLYIFNVNPGDVLTFFIPYEGSWNDSISEPLFQLVVDSVYRYEINGEALQKVVLKQLQSSERIYKIDVAFGIFITQRDSWGGSYVEKIGCEKSAFISPFVRTNRTAMGIDRDPEILCYKDSSFSVVYNYKDTPIQEECLYPGKLSIDNLSELAKNIVVYPNPARDVIQLKLPDGVFAPDEISILDFTGKTVQTISSSGNNQFSVQNLPHGIYTLAIPIEGNWYYVKMMKL